MKPAIIPTFKRLIGLLVLCSFVLGTQAHWTLLQVGAWGNMLIERTPGQGIEAALESTFSGKQPCCLCQVVESAASESNSGEIPERAPNPKGELEIKLAGVSSTDDETGFSYLNSRSVTFPHPSSDSLPPSALNPVVSPPPQS